MTHRKVIFNLLFNNKRRKIRSSPFVPCACLLVDSDGKYGWSWRQLQEQAERWLRPHSASILNQKSCQLLSSAPCHHTWVKENKTFSKGKISYKYWISRWIKCTMDFTSLANNNRCIQVMFYTHKHTYTHTAFSVFCTRNYNFKLMLRVLSIKLWASFFHLL